ncbi:MAG: flagellin [Candidatus Zixiibacteriota bacterium]
MSLRINNNVAAINAHRNLINTTNDLSKSMEKLSSGYQINRAADNPAGLVISEQFRAQIAGLNRAISNSEGSINMIQTAEGALNEINSLLVSMRELAIHAANEGFNDTAQLEADQAEIANAISTIDRIAANTQFGTKKLLDGTKANIATITSANSSGFSIRESGLSTGAHSITATKTADSTATINTTSYGLSLNSAVTPYNLTDGIHNIDVIQGSAGAVKTTDSIDILDAWNNGIEFGTAAVAQVGSSANPAATASSASAGTYTIELNYQENGEAVTGWQSLSVTSASSDSIATMVAAWNTQISNNAALVGKVEAANVGGSVVFRTTNTGTQYSIAQRSFSTDATSAWYDFGTDTDDRGVSDDDLRFNIDVNKATYTKSATITIAAGAYTTLSSLVTQLNTQLATAGGWGTVVGTTANVIASAVGTDRIAFTTMDEGSDYSIQLLGATVNDTTSARSALGMEVDAVALTGTDALVSFDNYTNAISAVNYASTSNITIANKAAGETGRGTVGFTVNTANQGVNLGSMLLDVTAAKFDVRLDSGPATALTAGVNSLVYNADRTESVKMNIDLTSNGGTETINNTDQSLVFQIGANVGQTASIGLANMSASSLGKNMAGNLFTSLANIDVTTVLGAQDSQHIIDSAITEVTNIRGTLGSFQKNTLESNLRNLRIASQNLQSSESSIRDTDMAKEMSTFVKNQILLQAGTAMLAQANQVPQAVLSLFG